MPTFHRVLPVAALSVGIASVIALNSIEQAQAQSTPTKILILIGSLAIGMVEGSTTAEAEEKAKKEAEEHQREAAASNQSPSSAPDISWVLLPHQTRTELPTLRRLDLFERAELPAWRRDLFKPSVGQQGSSSSPPPSSPSITWLTDQTRAELPAWRRDLFKPSVGQQGSSSSPPPSSPSITWLTDQTMSRPPATAVHR
jgi:hypothetical protein